MESPIGGTAMITGGVTVDPEEELGVEPIELSKEVAEEK